MLQGGTSKNGSQVVPACIGPLAFRSQLAGNGHWRQSGASKVPERQNATPWTETMETEPGTHPPVIAPVRHHGGGQCRSAFPATIFLGAVPPTPRSSCYLPTVPQLIVRYLHTNNDAGFDFAAGTATFTIRSPNCFSFRAPLALILHLLPILAHNILFSFTPCTTPFVRLLLRLPSPQHHSLDRRPC